ncbi:hypothetical protein Nepgr_003305 [Nepenthes gracilis]|uniref:Uncharacterized protein n=1 Tax=Nepenthes gracilis TaxID=150966 RepID=A0AAD3RZA0_NEPGR|nr:hypothetical protein Nepgr_003305 [Nepenthes gracilis]
MASSRIMRIATEVAPPQFVSAMRPRASKLLDTIHEEDTASNSDPLSVTSKMTSHGSPSPSKTAFSKYILKGMKGRVPIFGL